MILKPDRKLWTPPRSIVMPRPWWRQRGFFTPFAMFPSRLVGGADFDGTNDYMTKVSLTGQANSKSGIFSAWVRFDSVSGQRNIFGGVRLSDSLIAFDVYQLSNAITIEGADGTGTIFRIVTSGISITTAAWYHVLASWNMAASATHLYINDVDRKSVGAGPNDRSLLHSVVTQWTVGDYSPSDGDGARLDGGLAELYFAPGQFLDLSVETNRRKFITAAGKPANLGSNGAAPTGTAPISYQRLRKNEAVANFASNRGTGGDFSITGTLDYASSSPSD